MDLSLGSVKKARTLEGDHASMKTSSLSRYSPHILSKDDPVKLASLETIGPLFLILAVVWSFYFLKKDMFPENSVAYIVLVGFSFDVTSVSMHTLNKVCVSFTQAPSIVTVAQMMVALICFMSVYHREVLQANRSQMLRWCVVPIFYSSMLISSLFGYQALSLTLVQLLRNCAPLLTMCIEQFTMPLEHRPKFTVPVVGALFMTIVGSVMYSCTLEAFSFVGLGIIILNTILAILDRVVQRRLLVEECKDLPLQACMVINNSLGMLPTFAMAFLTHEFSLVDGNKANWTDPGIIALLIMSGVMGLGIGIFGLMCQKAMSATSFQVLQNCSKVAVVGIGMKLFGDQVPNLVGAMGLFLSLGGSAFYGYARTLEMPPTKKW
jgi:drug/metabolite transporter (DMT)-like permease